MIPRGYRQVKEAPLSVREFPELTFEVPCRKGRRWGKRRAHIYQHSTTLLGFSGTGTSLRKKLLAVGAEAWQTGDEEFSVVFPPTLLGVVAALVSPMSRRKGASKPG